jgi:hypothetical protein
MFGELLFEDMSLLKSDTPTTAQTANTTMVDTTRIGVQNVTSDCDVRFESIKLLNFDY